MATLEWFGTATWRLEVDGVVIWLDAYIDRAPTAPRLRLRAEEVETADWILIGHSHFDHIADAGLVAQGTGATVIGSQLSAEIVRDERVPEQRTIACLGGEVLQCGPVTVRAFPSLHGFNGIREYPDPQGRLREGRLAELRATDPTGAEAAMAHFRGVPEKQRNDGGPLAYLLQWGGFTLFWHDTPGIVTTSWEAAAAHQPGLALLAVAAGFSTPNVDGVPWEGSHQEFVGHMAALLRPRRVILNHHDDWGPPVTYHLDEELFRPAIHAAGSSLEVLVPNSPLEL